MIDSRAVQYLKENKDKFSFEKLERTLEKAGYPKDVIHDSWKEVSSTDAYTAKPAVAHTQFWDFKTKKLYTTRSEKIKDFLFGFFGDLVIGWCISLPFMMLAQAGVYTVSSLATMIIFLVEVFVVVYLLSRRKYVALGIIVNALFNWIVISTGFIYLFGGIPF